jgi:hypothetical protein
LAFSREEVGKMLTAADAHVEESPAMFSYLENEFYLPRFIEKLFTDNPRRLYGM